MPATLKLSATPACVKCQGKTTSIREDLKLVNNLQQQVTMEQCPAFRCQACDDSFIPQEVLREVIKTVNDPRYGFSSRFTYEEGALRLFLVRHDAEVKLTVGRCVHQVKLMAFGALEGVTAEEVSEVIGPDPDFPLEEVTYALSLTPKL